MSRPARAAQSQETERGLATAGEVAALLGVPTSWVYEQSRRGRIPTVALGRYRRFRLDAIEAWIQEQEALNGVAHRASPRRRFKQNGAPPQDAGSSRPRDSRVSSLR